MDPATTRPGDCVFVVFSDDWARHPSSCQHLFRWIVFHTDVIWVNTVGLRTPRLSWYDLKRAVSILRGWLTATPKLATAAKQSEAQPTVLRPFMLPFMRWRWVRWLNERSIMSGLKKHVSSVARGRKVVLVSTLPIFPYLFKSDLFARKIYYCVDDFTVWPGVDGAMTRELEAELVPQCDVLVATSSYLIETRGSQASRAELLTHGVDTHHFLQSRDNSIVAAEMASFSKPVVGLVGVFDDRTDGELLKAVAKRIPHANIAVLGPVDRDISEFRCFENIHFIGPVPYQRLPEYIAAFSVCILPYHVNETTRSINPLKLKEYLCTGKPVVTTPLPEALKLQRYLTVGDSAKFPGLVEQALGDERREQSAIDAFLADEAWEKKAARFVAIGLADL